MHASNFVSFMGRLISGCQAAARKRRQQAQAQQGRGTLHGFGHGCNRGKAGQTGRALGAQGEGAQQLHLVPGLTYCPIGAGS